jgi:hypothetical protein
MILACGSVLDQSLHTAPAIQLARRYRTAGTSENVVVAG